MKITANQIAKTIHFERRPAGKVKREPRTGSASISEQSSQRVGVGDRSLADEAFADVGGWLTVDRRAIGEQLRLLAPLRATGQDQVGPEGGPNRGRELRKVLADQGHLLGREEVEVDRPEQVAESLGVLACRAREEAEDALGGAFVGALTGQGSEAEQAEGGGGVAGGDRVVADLLATGDQRFVIVRGGEEAAALRVGEAGEQGVGKVASAFEPDGLEARFVEGEQGLEQEGMVLEVG